MHRKNKEIPKKDNLILIGFMGSGKTSLGLRLSYRLQMTVEDTDKRIEAEQGRSISEIFAREGEGAFRQMETELLRRIRDEKTCRIYSLGGGTPVQLQNQPLICRSGIVVYLRIRPESVYERLKGDTRRPLLQCADPLSRIRELIRQRGPAYERCADLIVDVDESNQAQITEQIAQFYLERTGRADPQLLKEAREQKTEGKDENTGDQRTESELPGDPGEGGLRDTGLQLPHPDDCG